MNECERKKKATSNDNPMFQYSCGANATLPPMWSSLLIEWMLPVNFKSVCSKQDNFIHCFNATERLQCPRCQQITNNLCCNEFLPKNARIFIIPDVDLMLISANVDDLVINYFAVIKGFTTERKHLSMGIRSHLFRVPPRFEAIFGVFPHTLNFNSFRFVFNHTHAM